MRNFLSQLWSDECGFVVSSELVFVATLLVIGLTTGFSAIRNQVVGELADVADAVSELDQSYSFAQITAANASTRGAAFGDQNDLGEANAASQDQVAGALPTEDGLAISAGSGEQ